MASPRNKIREVKYLTKEALFILEKIKTGDAGFKLEDIERMLLIIESTLVE